MCKTILPQRSGASTFNSHTSETTENDVINQPFTMVEIITVIKLSKNNKSSDEDYMIITIMHLYSASIQLPAQWRLY